MNTRFSGLALAIGLVVSGPVFAQQDDLLDLARQLVDQDNANAAKAEELGRRLTACLPADDRKSASRVRIAVDTDAAGAIAGPAAILDPVPEEASLEHIQLLLRAEAAVGQCAPLEVEDVSVASSRLTLDVVPDAITVVDVSPVAPPATEASEAALDLNRADRREIQIRLSLAGQEPGGADGIFGPRSREAIRDWQTASSLPASGFLDADQLGMLISDTDTAYAEFLEEAAQPAASTSRQAQPRRKRSRVYRGRDGCLRYANGRIVPKQSIRCDARGLIQF